MKRNTGAFILVIAVFALSIFGLTGCGLASMSAQYEREQAMLEERMEYEFEIARLEAELAEAKEAKTENIDDVTELENTTEVSDEVVTNNGTDEDDTRYDIIGNGIMESFLADKELAKTGDPEMDVWLQNFYEKLMGGDIIIDEFFDIAESYGVDASSVIDALIDYNASIKFGISTDDLEDTINKGIDKLLEALGGSEESDVSDNATSETTE